ncbi:MAG: Bug family tripartite tricarboxylate transporter substrate binding protein [Burkholderiales bacterium]
MRPLASVNFLAAFAIVCAMASPATAQTWPVKPLRILLSSAPGATSDTVSRGLAEVLTKSLGQPVIVDNRVGAEGQIGMEACARATPDGYTLCGTTSNVIIWNMVLKSKLPYNSLRDFAPVMHASFFDSALVAHASRPYNSVRELVDFAKANPDKVNWGHFGVNSTGYMYLSYLNKNRGVRFYPVPYKTQPQNMLALVANETDLTITAINTAAPHMKSGKLKALAVTSAKRVDWMPTVPTFEEEEIKLPLRSWEGYHYPIAVPKEQIDRMNLELRRAYDNPLFRANVLDKAGLVSNTGSPEAFDQHIRAQLKAVAELVNYLGIKPE